MAGDLDHGRSVSGRSVPFERWVQGWQSAEKFLDGGDDRAEFVALVVGACLGSEGIKDVLGGEVVEELLEGVGSKSDHES